MPWFNPLYSSYFWVGLERVFGSHNLRIEDTDGLSGNPSFNRWKSTFAFIANNRRYIIDGNDYPTLGSSAAEWADCIGAVNLSAAEFQERKDKVVTLGPAFSVRRWSAFPAALLGPFFRSRPPQAIYYRRLIATLRAQAQRQPITSYMAAQPSADSASISFIGSWYAQHNDANQRRAATIRSAIEAVGPDRVDAKLVVHGDELPADLAEYRSQRIDQAAYLEAMRASLLVVDHPAVHGCWGWKLGEALALGKAIVTTPNSNVLANPLEHGVHVHYASPDGLSAAIREVAFDSDYRRHLENGARIYWENYLQPHTMIERLLFDRR